MTQVLEADGLFKDTRRTGYLRQWEALLAAERMEHYGACGREVVTPWNATN
ncbi:hypothetical protein [Desulfonatronum parangueonense]